MERILWVNPKGNPRWEISVLKVLFRHSLSEKALVFQLVIKTKMAMKNLCFEDSTGVDL